MRTAIRTELRAAEPLLALVAMTAAADPAPGDGYHYPIGVRNGCDETPGFDSDGEPRPPEAPCN